MTFRWRRRPLAAAVAAMVLGACGGARLASPVGDPVPDPAAFVDRLRETTLRPGPEQITFQWTLEERGSRVGGRGVVRVEAPERIRLDLFGPRDETYLIAALVGDEYRFPTAEPPPVRLPSPSLLWAALGVFEPPESVPLASATTTETSADVRFGAHGADMLVYTFQSSPGGEHRLARVERAGPRGVLETVAITRDGAGQIGAARYRDWSEFRDLILEVQSTRAADPFPPNIWRPGAETP